MTHGVFALRGEGRYIPSNIRMSSDNTKDCQPGTEKSHGGLDGESYPMCGGEILRTKISPGLLKRPS